MDEGKRSPSYYSISLNLNGKKCVVVGGGHVSLRKIKALLEHKAIVEVISPILCPELQRLARNREVKVFQRNYRAGDIKGAFLTIVATDDTDINREVAAEAKRLGVLVNVVNDPERSDFIVPSYLHRGDLTITVSTAGKSPALARKIRAVLEKNFEEEYASLTNLISDVRTELNQRGVAISRSAWQEALDLDLLTRMVRSGQIKKAKAALLNHLEMSGQTTSPKK